MRVGSRVNRQSQVEVVVRLKPESGESRGNKCVYVSDHSQGQLVVETECKKEIFVFDHIAHELASQQDIYRMIGEECVAQAFQGYNCCLFAYGQTGAGKTYSVLGDLPSLSGDSYAASRGLLPRVLQDVCEKAGVPEQGEQIKVTCSYIQIYNQQILDLLSADKRIHQIREDAKRGVFVEGLIERKVTGYRSAIALLLQGEKTRKMAATLMNTESSRSHVIFSVLIESEVAEEQVLLSKKAKLHVVDLAGSQRVKHTNVEGQRLREGCSINRSLHVLGNVINCLVQSSLRKKHIPFRDSKLTHYLKDSLGGNSITKLLANVHTGRQYFGDTLSTLMFAKRAKSLKNRVELNQTSAQNFQSLRKEIRRLREQLAQARYFKGEGRMSDRTSLEPQQQEEENQRKMREAEMGTCRVEPSPRGPQRTQLQVSPKNEVLLALQKNQLHYKALLEIYEQHMKTCLSTSNMQRKQNINIVKEWKNLQKRNISLTNILKQVPTFTKIYKENLLLRQERMMRTQPLFATTKNLSQAEQLDNDSRVIEPTGRDVEQVVAFYENLLSEMDEKLRTGLDTLERAYLELENECKAKDKKIKDLKQKRQNPPDINQLKNQNEYLHLSILNLQNQIQKLQENEQRLKVQLRQSKRNTAKKGESKPQSEEDFEEGIYERLMEIRREAEKESAQVDVERAETQMIIHKLQAEINKYMAENSRLREKYSKSKSKRKSPSKRVDQVRSVKHGSSLKPIQGDTPEQKDIFRSEVKYVNSFANSFASREEDAKTTQSYTRELLVLKMDLKRKQKEITDLKKELDLFINGDKRIEEQFGKTLQQIIEEYRNILSGRKTLQQSKSVKAIYGKEELQGSLRQSQRQERVEKGGNPRVNINLK